MSASLGLGGSGHAVKGLLQTSPQLASVEHLLDATPLWSYLVTPSNKDYHCYHVVAEKWTFRQGKWEAQ